MEWADTEHQNGTTVDILFDPKPSEGFDIHPQGTAVDDLRRRKVYSTWEADA